MQYSASGVRMHEIRTNRSSGFSLIELMIVVALIAILAGIAYPNYTEYLQKSRRADATTMLMQLASMQEQFFQNNRRYASTFVELGFDDPATVTSQKGYYQIGFVAADSGNFQYRFSAVSQGAQSGDTACGTFFLNNRGERTVSGTAESCW